MATGRKLSVDTAAVISDLWRRHPDASLADVASEASRLLGMDISMKTASRFKPAELRRKRDDVIDPEFTAGLDVDKE